MKTHREIDDRSLALARAVVSRIDGDPQREGLRRARETSERWFRENPAPAVAEWRTLLQGDWDAIRLVLLDESEAGKRLRQNSPFCGVLTSQERWDIYRRFAHDAPAA